MNSRLESVPGTAKKTQSGLSGRGQREIRVIFPVASCAGTDMLSVPVPYTDSPAKLEHYRADLLTEAESQPAVTTLLTSMCAGTICCWMYTYPVEQ